jgi:hypothetical protein
MLTANSTGPASQARQGGLAAAEAAAEQQRERTAAGSERGR